MDESKPLVVGATCYAVGSAALIARRESKGRGTGRGLHLSTFRLNLSATCGIGGAFRGCLGVA